MDRFLLLGALVCLLCVCGFMAVLLARGRRREPISHSEMAEWFDSFNVASYRPMERLLLESDYEFLRRQPGYEVAIEQRLRASRKRAFRGYLSKLRSDYAKLDLFARTMLVYSVDYRPGYIAQLWRERIRFGCVSLTIEAGLLTGMHPQPRILIDSLESLRARIAEITAAPRAIASAH